MDVKLFQYHSVRASKARLSVRLRPWISSLKAAALLLLVAGVALLVLGWPIGWALIGLAMVPAMVAEWYAGELVKLPVANKPERIDDFLDVAILGHLPKQPSPQDIATIVGTTNEGHFFAVRLGVSAGMVQQLVTADAAATAELWRDILQLREQLGATSIGGGIILAAMFDQLPSRDALLGHLQLDDQDLRAGVRWYQHIQDIITDGRRSKRPGGIGRDWSFGWIPTLRQFGHNISEGAGGGGRRLSQAHQEALDQLTTTLAGSSQRTVVVVGKPGAGKTELMYSLADQLMDPMLHSAHALKFNQVFLLDAASLIAQAPGRGELEGLVDQLLNEAFKAKNIIVCLDEAQLFFEEGVGSVDLTNLLLPVLQAGRLPIVLAMDEQRYLEISRRSPALAGGLTRINLAPASRDETLQIMQDQLLGTEYRHKVTYMYQALKEAYRLSERYVYDRAMPGQALQLLDAAASYATDGIVSAVSVEQAIEKTLSIKVGRASDNDEKDKLLNLETLIHERMVNQTRAVGVVSDALRRARAGVRNQNRPIGTFLFLGPTGVGKTELAKALAAIYFDGEDNIIRLDMNEFVAASDVSRLIADASNDPNSLSAQIIKQPFSVVLLDEIEKAHSSVLTTLLQLLDEGILRDENNREVSFRDAIIIATSNAGAGRIREYIERGYTMEQFEDQFVDELISDDTFHPEFLNRFDEIVVFSPLSKDDLMKVVDLILASVNQTLAAQKVSVVVSDDAKRYLVDKGYDPRLGARPMRRVVQRAVENTVAKKMLAGEVQPGEVVEIGLDEVKQILDTKRQADQLASGDTTSESE